MNINIYQIYYDELTREMLAPGFIPLDNTENLRPDWFEFWVILNFLQKNELKDNNWYGFLSPRFYEKTEFSSNFVIKALENFGNDADVMLFSPGWDQLFFFLNPFEQGDMWHPGLLTLSQKFIDSLNLNVNLSNLVTDMSCSVFSNYIIAKREFWIKWKTIAEAFFNYSENNPELTSLTKYGTAGNRLPIKTFIQERFASLILATEDLKTVAPDQSFSVPISPLFHDNPKTRRLLQGCDLMKSKYRETLDGKFLSAYWDLRKNIQLHSVDKHN